MAFRTARRPEAWIAASSHGMPRFPDRWILVVALAVHVATAWFSTGFHSADEHYQVIAFAEAKLGHQPVEELPWEHAAQVRSAFLPTLSMLVFLAAGSAGMHDPFVLAFLLRLLTALFALWAVRRFTLAVRHLVPPPLWRAFLFGSFLLWFLPFLHVRFTGEAWSGLFILLALAALLRPAPARHSFLHAGVFLGLAFLCRPPTLVIALGLGLWLAVEKRAQATRLLQLGLGFLAMALAGLVLDSWFYGQPVLTAWNYLQTGITGDSPHPFTEFPWWYYYAWAVKYAIPLFGIPLLLAFGLACALQPRHFLVWATVPFLVMHMLIPHKDLRFLYPLAGLMPLLLVTAAPLAQAQFPRAAQLLRRPAIRRAVLMVLLGANMLALGAVAFAPAGSGRTRLAAYIHAHYPGQPLQINYQADASTVWDIRIPPFYLPPASTDSLVAEPCKLLHQGGESVQLLITDQGPPLCEVAGAARWVKVEDALPGWKQFLLRAYAWEDHRPRWALYEARPGPA